MLVSAVERSYLFATFKASSITSMLITTVFARTARVMTMTTLSCPHAHRLDVSAAEPDGENDSAEDEIRSVDSYPAYLDESYSDGAMRTTIPMTRAILSMQRPTPLMSPILLARTSKFLSSCVFFSW